MPEFWAILGFFSKKHLVALSVRDLVYGNSDLSNLSKRKLLVATFQYVCMFKALQVA
jgi:hypothetical protein